MSGSARRRTDAAKKSALSSMTEDMAGRKLSFFMVSPWVGPDLIGFINFSVLFEQLGTDFLTGRQAKKLQICLMEEWSDSCLGLECAIGSAPQTNPGKENPHV
jgi:hypothetical protein